MGGAEVPDAVGTSHTAESRLHIFANTNSKHAMRAGTPERGFPRPL